MAPFARDHLAPSIVTEHDPSANDVHWAEPEPGFWVAARGGDFVGTVTAEGARFITRDATGSLGAEYESLSVAQSSLTAAAP